MTGAVGSVKSEDMMQRPSTSISQSISGRIAGVNISSNSGRPGGNQTIRIRGYSSINATNEPLYIIDGVPGDINILNQCGRYPGLLRVERCLFYRNIRNQRI